MSKPMTNAEQRARRERNRAAGLCGCGRRPRPGLKQCSSCSGLEGESKRAPKAPDVPHAHGNTHLTFNAITSVTIHRNGLDLAALNHGATK